MVFYSRLRALQVLFAVLLGSWLPGTQAQLIISEIYYDAEGTDNGHVFVELMGLACTDLTGYSLLGINGLDGSTYKTVPLFGSIPEDSIFVIGDDDGTGNTAVLNVDLITDVDFQNGPDSIQLWDGASLLDAVGYGDFSSAVFAGEGVPAMDASAGTSLARRVPFGDTDNNAADFIVLDMPTPGTLASFEVPLPGTLGLFAAGLLMGGRRLVFG